MQSCIVEIRMTFSAHIMDSGSDDLVPCGFGAKRGLDPLQHVTRALQQVHPHASMQAVLEPKLDAVAKLVASKILPELNQSGQPKVLDTNGYALTK